MLAQERKRPLHGGTLISQEHDTVPVPPAPDFVSVLRGYDRGPVDTYVRRLRSELQDALQRIAELERELHSVRSNGTAAPADALDGLSTSVKAVLQAANAQAEALRAEARRSAEETKQQAEREASERAAAATRRVAEIEAAAADAAQERDRILEEAREQARRMLHDSEQAADQKYDEILAAAELQRERLVTQAH